MGKREMEETGKKRERGERVRDDWKEERKRRRTIGRREKEKETGKKRERGEED